MTPILIKILAMGLALAQITTRPDAVRTAFDQASDQTEMVSLLRDGCAHFRKAFDIESINLDDLITTAMDDPKAVDSRIEALHGVKLEDLLKVYQQFCKGTLPPPSADELSELAKFYNETLADLPDHTKLKEQVMLGQTEVIDANGDRFAAMGDPSHQRRWIALRDVPEKVQMAFVAAEDKRFFQHGGGDERDGIGDGHRGEDRRRARRKASSKMAIVIARASEDGIGEALAKGRTMAMTAETQRFL